MTSLDIRIIESVGIVLCFGTHRLPLCSPHPLLGRGGAWCLLDTEQQSFGSRFEESRRTAKRPSSDRRDSYPEERKRVATERRYEGPGRFDDGTRYTSVLRYKDDSQIAVCSA